MESRKIILLALERKPVVLNSSGYEPAFNPEFIYSAKFLVVYTARIFELDINKEEFKQLKSFFDSAFDVHFYFDFEFGKEKVDTSGTSKTIDTVNIGTLNDDKVELDKAEEKKSGGEL